MSQKLSIGDAEVQIPNKWAFSSTLLHFEGEDLSQDPRPFAANVVVQSRIDVPDGTAAELVATADLSLLKTNLPGFQLVSDQDAKAGQKSVTAIEYTFRDSSERVLQQLILYCQSGKRLYTVTATHVAGSRFGVAKEAVLRMASDLIR